VSEGYWVVSVDRDTGDASTSELFTERDAAWQHSIDIETPATFTMVIKRRARPPDNLA